ncbi:MAG: sialate O-acetylesterase [Phycisphaerae bacterium]|nr:sialate O-acetylesterase [Phycisphaerae bacterium]
MLLSLKRTILSFVTLILTLPLLAHADVKLPAVINANMVLQQQTDAPLWGWAEPDEKITVTANWPDSLPQKTTADAKGQWQIKLTTPSYGGPYTVTITGNNTITLNNVLIGEVWLCSGQSNMAMTVSRCQNGLAEVAIADFPQIRLFKVARAVSNTPQDDCQGNWQACSPEAIADFSGTAYFFGRTLHQNLNVPIGLIQSAWGGTAVEAWTARSYFDKLPNIDVVLNRWKDTKAWSDQDKKNEKVRYEKALTQWKQAAKKARTNNEKIPGKPSPKTEPLKSQNYPSNLYNAMINPLAPFALRGAIWYQGEANSRSGIPGLYKDQLTALITNWRERWGRGDFPFYYVQLPNYRDPQKNPSEFMANSPNAGWMIVREDMLKTLDVPNTGMAVTIDIGEAKNIHPKNKQDVGRRLALWALAKDYGKDIVYSGPIYRSISFVNDKVIINFDHVGSGLTFTGDALKTFAIAGEDKKFVRANARLFRNAVIVSSDQVKKPVAVRYAWAVNPNDSNLYNKEGLPASPFRTDNWSPDEK